MIVNKTDLEREHNNGIVGDPTNVPLGLRAAYTAWRQHHATCPYCKVHDWYDPGAPRLIPEDQWESWMTRYVNKDGKEFRLHNGPDPAVLCRTGAGLFQSWVWQSMSAQAKRAV